MASTVQSSTLKVTLTERIVLNGSDHGSSNELSISDINEASKRIVTTNGTSATTVVSFGPTPAGGTYVDSDVRYIRITNLDDTNYATLRITGDASTDFAVRLDPYSNYIITSTSTTGVVDYADISGVTLDNLVAISATANTAAVDLEIFVASA
tara:strand:- start:16209 stop:16667 length:459 start_codon:yes stop_codon:yes gene_type:complete